MSRPGKQPALRLSALLSPPVSLGDAEALIALIDTFPWHPTLGRPGPILVFVFLLLSGRKLGCGPALCLAPVPLEPRLGEKGGDQGLDQNEFRSVASVPC